LKKEENFDILFASGEKMTLKNQFPINCEGAFAHKLNAKEIDEIILIDDEGGDEDEDR